MYVAIEMQVTYVLHAHAYMCYAYMCYVVEVNQTLYSLCLLEAVAYVAIEVVSVFPL